MATIDRRKFTGSLLALGIVGASPARVLADIATVPRSDYGFATTAAEVVAGLNLSGKTAVITGCNSGLGLESMRALAGAGAHVIGTARTAAKAEAAAAGMDGEITPLVCELTDFDSVLTCSAAIVALGKPIDILMTNAGIMAPRELGLVYGLEQQFVVNHLSHFLLTRELMPLLERAEQGRVVALSSIGYQNAPPEGINFDNLDGSLGYKPFTFYGQSKLANALFARELARKNSGTSLTANSVHPGLVATNLGRYVSGKPRDPNEPLRKGFKTPEQGAATQVYVAASPAMSAVSGYYFEDCNPVEPKGPHMQNDKLALKLWETSESLIGAIV
jgi:NAD(P)-dependent dehydrogenase (short-subunit alcohol dehydrogenase family)